MSKYNDLKNSILADGKIDEAEVQMLRKELFADGIIDRDEANLLFELNDATSGKNNHSSWQNLFVEAITAHLLEDEDSPGEIDDTEATWLISCIEKRGVQEANIKVLLKNIKIKAKKVSEKLREKLQ